MHDNLSFKLQRNADLPLHLARWREKTRNYTNTTLYPGLFGQNSEIILRMRLGGISKMVDIYISSDLQLGKLKENFLATQAFANPEIISEPQTGIEPATF